VSRLLRPDIQGLRAVAVAAVVAHHAFRRQITGGYVGVDIFFVISGFLISGILIRDIENQRFSVLNFYRRRVRRIFPALLPLMFCTLVAGYFLLGPLPYRELARNSISTMLFVSNFDFWKLSGYFSSAAELKPLLHMWSLAVEEQFYILYPPILYLIWRGGQRRRGAALILLAIVLSVVAAELIRSRSESAAYYLLPARAFELLLGALISTGVIAPIKSKSRNSTYSWVGLMLIVVPIVLYTPDTPFPGLTALIPCLGTAILIHAGQGTGTSSAARLISVQPFRFVGDVSYSFYLWHWPVLAFMRNVYSTNLTLIQSAAAIVLALAAASASYYFIEQPFLGEKGRRLPYISLGVASIAIFCAAGGLIYIRQGLPVRFSPEVRGLFAAANDFNVRRNVCHYDNNSGAATYATNCSFGAQSAKPDTAVWADSHGAELAVVLGDRAKSQSRSVMEITSSGCPPALKFAWSQRPHCPERNQGSLEGLVADSDIRTVIIAANAAVYPDPQALMSGLEESVKSLVAVNKAVILVKQIPVMDFDPPQRIGISTVLGIGISDIGMKTFDQVRRSKSWNAFLDELATKYAAVTTFDPQTYLCDSNICRAYDDHDGVLYFNPDHLSLRGANAVFKELMDRLYGTKANSPSF
jgi:peptidoglycan/LPS O-acetylase OafA/YrhL